MRLDLLHSAWKFASTKHDGQKYGGPKEGQQIEHIEHIGSVLFEVQSSVKNDSSIDYRKACLGAILHDTLEDTDCTEEEIRWRFGSDVLEIVKALTKNEDLSSKEAMMIDSLERIRKTYREVAIIKMADRISNLYSPPFYWNREKVQAYVKESYLIYKSLSEYSDVLSFRLLTKIEKYEIDFLQNHSKEYQNWKLRFRGNFTCYNLNELLKTLRGKFSPENIRYKSRIIGEEITISTDFSRIWIEGNNLLGQDLFSIQFEEDRFINNIKRLEFLKTLKDILQECTQQLILEYSFETDDDESQEFRI